MFEISQSLDTSNLINIPDKSVNATLNLNIEAIEDLLEIITDRMNSPYSKNELKLLKNCYNDVLKLYKTVVNTRGKCSIQWGKNRLTGNIGNRGIDLSFIPEIGMKLTDIINLELPIYADETNVKYSEDYKQDLVIMKIDCRKLCEVMITDIMSNDIGYSFEDMEENLKDIGVLRLNDADRVLKYFRDNNETMFMQSRYMMIGESPYNLKNTKEYCTMTDYFGEKSFNSKFYASVVDYSINRVLSILVTRVLKIINTFDIEHSLLAYNYSGIYIAFPFKIDTRLNTDAQVNKVVSLLKTNKTINDKVGIRTFGRWFDVTPDISYYTAVKITRE